MNGSDRPHRSAGEGVDFKFAQEQEAYWDKVINQIRDGKYGQIGKEEREIYATACLAEWKGIKQLLCQCHEMKFMQYDGRGHELLKCHHCGAMEIRNTVVGRRD